MSDIEKETVLALRPVTSEDWDTIPSGIGSRLLTHLLVKSDLYGRVKVSISDSDICSLSTCGEFGGAIAFAIGGETGRKEWQSRWRSNRDAVAIVLGLLAQKSSLVKFTDKDVTSSVMRQPDIIRGMFAVDAFDPYYGKSPFSVLGCEEIKAVYEQDMGAVAAIAAGDSRHAGTVFSCIPENARDFWHEMASIQKSPLQTIGMVSSHVSPCSATGMTIMDFLAPQFGERWNPKASRDLRTHAILDRDVTEWRQRDDGWLRLALNYCTENHPDRLVRWIGDAPCLYEFLNTAAKQRRGIIAARRLIRMVGR